MTSSQKLSEDCRLSHNITSDSRQYAYEAVYRVQKDYGDKLPWQLERDVFHEALHEYESKNPDKIAT
jgi:hypothetical protein